jgi:hypothetical protein
MCSKRERSKTAFSLSLSLSLSLSPPPKKNTQTSETRDSCIEKGRHGPSNMGSKNLVTTSEGEGEWDEMTWTIKNFQELSNEIQKIHKNKFCKLWAACCCEISLRNAKFQFSITTKVLERISKTATAISLKIHCNTKANLEFVLRRY